MSAKAVSLAIPTTVSGALMTSVDGVTEVPTALFGWSLAESTGAASAKVRLRDGSLTGPVLATIAFSANESARDWFGEQVLEVQNGAIFLEIVSGSVEGAVYWS